MTRPTIEDYFEGRDIFITGGSGFMGKVLIEKLLRSCSKLNKIYILLRSKKGKNAEERLQIILNLPLFDLLRAENPSALEKVQTIEGDVTIDDLGISEPDRELMKNVSIVFHSAASVRFDDPLKDAILMNTKGTLEVMKFAETLKNLKALVHVSTTYCYPDRKVVKEELYPPYADWRTTLKLAENYSEETLDIFFPKYSQFQPNTYTFTKSLSEHIVNDYKEKLPVVIYRPSIVISSVSEPIPGWIDNLNGPVGMFLASGVGLLRTMHGDPDVVSDYTPVDLAIKAMIITAYKKGLENTRELEVYNCSTSSVRAVPYKEIIRVAKDLGKDHPLERAVWVPGGNVTPSATYNFIRFLLFQFLVAIGLDVVMRLTKNKPFFVKLQRRIYQANLALRYFTKNHWTFKNEKFFALDKYIVLSDREGFAFLHNKDLDLKIFFRNALIGVKRFILHEPVECSQGARIRYKVMSAIHCFVKVTFWYTVFIIVRNYVYSKCSFLNKVMN